MAKRNLVWNHNKLNRYLKEGRGQGKGAHYKPWLTVDFHFNLGKSTLILSH